MSLTEGRYAPHVRAITAAPGASVEDALNAFSLDFRRRVEAGEIATATITAVDKNGDTLSYRLP